MVLRNLTSPESIRKIETEELQRISDLILEELALRDSWKEVQERAAKFDSVAKTFKACVEDRFGGIEKACMDARNGEKGATVLLNLMMECFEGESAVFRF